MSTVAPQAREWLRDLPALLGTEDGLRRSGSSVLALLEEFDARSLAATSPAADRLATACVLLGDGRYASAGSAPAVLVFDHLEPDAALEAVREHERTAGAVEGVVGLTCDARLETARRLRSLGYRVGVAFGPLEDDAARADEGEAPPSDDARVASGLHPAVAAKRALEHYLGCGRLPGAPDAFDRHYDAPGGLWLSARRRSDGWLLGRGGAWSLDEDPAPVTVATWTALHRMLADGERRIRRVWPEVKLAVTLVDSVERVAPGRLDHRRHGVLAVPAGRRRPVGDAPPNGQGIADELQQIRHARSRARLGPHDTADLYRYASTKLVEPGEQWLPFAAPPSRPGGPLGHELVRLTLAGLDGRPAAADDGVLDELASGVPIAGVAVSVYRRGVVGCATAWRGGPARMVADAARAAYRDPRLADHVAAEGDVDAVVVTLMHTPTRVTGVTAEYFARTLQRGLDAYSVRQGDRFAVFLDSVIPHFDWPPRHALEQLLAKAGIGAGTVTWTSYRTASWVHVAGRTHDARGGLPVRTRAAPASVAVERLAGYLMEHRGADGLVAWRTFPIRGRQEPRGILSHALHALYALACAGTWAGRPDWKSAATDGLLAVLDRRESWPVACGWRSGWGANAVLALGAGAIDVPDERREQLGSLAADVRRAVQPDGRVAAPPAAGPSGEEHDYLPGTVILALAALATRGVDFPAVDWTSTLDWYRRRFRLAHPWGMAFWHPQAWAAVHALEPRPEYAEFAFEVADWALERQLEHSGAFVTDPSPAIPSFHTACAAEGVAAARALAERLGDRERARRYGEACRRAADCLAQLTIAPEDLYCMRDAAALGGVRMHAASGEVRADYVGHALLFALEAQLL